MFRLAHTMVSAPGAQPVQWMLVAHGIFGSAANWRSFARALCERRPDWGLILVDLRMHGKSQGAPPPHTVAQAAGDLVTLADELGRQGTEVRAVCGHSFGGKVAMELCGQVRLAQAWVLDASPSARPEAIDDADNTVTAVLRMLRSLPGTFASREEFLAAVTGRGFAAGIAQWLAMNLDRQGSTYLFRLDLDAIEALLTDYYHVDAWQRLGLADDTQVVVAGRSQAVTAEDRARLAALAGRGVTTTVIENAGHWVHIDAPDTLVALVAARLPAISV